MREVRTLFQVLLWALILIEMQCVSIPPTFGKENATKSDEQRQHDELLLDTLTSGSQELKALAPKVDTRSGPSRPGKRMLVGRIQEIATGNPVSPATSTVGSELSGKQSHDPSPVRSYPADFQGMWSGPFVVMQIPGASAHDGSILYPGRNGNGTVGFIKSKDQGTEVSPLPIVFFDLTDEEKRRLHVPVSQQHAQAHVGFGEAQNAVLGDGSIKNSRNVINVIKLLSDRKTLEQQIVEESQIDSPQTHETFAAVRESIFQFSRLQSDLMDVHLAAVEYKKDGSLMSKMILHGRLIRQK